MNDANSLKGKTCMITGASSGIGKITAIELAKLGARLLLVCRDRTRGETTVAEIAAKTGNRDVELMIADLGSQRQIRQLASNLLERNEPLHVLINNAGLVNLSRTVTEDGIETTFAVNHLAYFMLTLLLLDLLKRSAPARIINVASDVHKIGSMNFDDLGGERRYRGFRIYGRSKLANILFTYELARRLEGAGVTVNCAHPGAVSTGFGKNNGALARLVLAVAGPFMRTPERGAQTSIYLASAPEVGGVSGKYYLDCKPHQSSAESYDQATARRLWEVSAQMTGVG
jgi:NAD(P)-dependent dehydrogenase (short-subunit alcohol dehydrogenase family)